ncbi:hypothetical protein Cni_G27603 [Canna indica]|uniref:DUF868 family protein n=1 Tax=Canna indica TaxID=4628 RepID=A0AAQ3L5W6_9LILI|nr:hypothetical protein Cni_G27603 [Canna indica]
MRDFASGCFGDAAVSVAGDSSARGGRQPLLNSVSCFYRATLASTGKELLVKVIWHKNNGDASVAVVVDDGLSSSLFEPIGTNSLLLRKKGSRSFFSAKSIIVAYWDIAAAKYASGPEPSDDFYLILMADGELILLLGDKCGDFIKTLSNEVPVAEFSMYCRKERVLVGAGVQYSTKARFRDGGRDHEVSIVCRGNKCDAGNAELCICIDKKRLVQVKSISWNFRGNQIIFVDGSAVDVLWDVHDWWFRESSGGAVFAFRARSTTTEISRLWRGDDEELAKGKSHFSLLIQAFKSA